MRPATPRLAAAALLVAVVALAVPWPPAGVERAFATGVYPVWQRASTSLTNLVPFAIFDVVLAGAVTVLVLAGVRAWRGAPGRPMRRAGAAALAMLGVAAAVYLWFLLAWGFNYQRLPLATRLGIDRGRATSERLSAFAEETVTELNRLHPLAHGRAWPDREALVARLLPPFRAILPQVGARADVVAGRPKWSLLQPYLRWAGIDGVTNPFVPEVIVNHDLLPLEWPFTLAHEWGHLAGLAHEAEASYLAFLTCLSGDEPAQYSARLWAFAHIFATVPPDERLRLANRLHQGPRADLRAIAARSARSVRIVRQVSWTAYDRYLKSNRVAEGLASYDAAIVLILARMPEDMTNPQRQNLSVVPPPADSPVQARPHN